MQLCTLPGVSTSFFPIIFLESERAVSPNPSSWLWVRQFKVTYSISLSFNQLTLFLLYFMDASSLVFYFLTLERAQSTFVFNSQSIWYIVSTISPLCVLRLLLSTEQYVLVWCLVITTIKPLFGLRRWRRQKVSACGFWLALHLILICFWWRSSRITTVLYRRASWRLK